VVRLKIRPIIIKHIKISVHRLNRQKPAHLLRPPQRMIRSILETSADFI
jgi:hypothetical protein